MGRPKGSKNKPKTNGLLNLAQDLVNYCAANGTTGQVELELKLPEAVLNRFSKTFEPQERIVLTGNNQEVSRAAALVLNGGTVTLSATETTTQQGA